VRYGEWMKEGLTGEEVIISIVCVQPTRLVTEKPPAASLVRAPRLRNLPQPARCFVGSVANPMCDCFSPTLSFLLSIAAASTPLYSALSYSTLHTYNFVGSIVSYAL